MKKYLFGFVCFFWAAMASAQDIFWSFDDNQNPLPIPAECDAKFDEIRGGVFVPTVDEMYEYGMAFIKNGALPVQQQGAYCLLGAALQGHPDAQLEVARLYEEGRVLPQDDLSAYKWAFIAALNGKKSAEKITLMLEQLLTTEDLERTSTVIYDTNTQIKQNLQKKLEEERRQTEEERSKLEQMTTESTSNEMTKEREDSSEKISPEEVMEEDFNFGHIFEESDRMK